MTSIADRVLAELHLTDPIYAVADAARGPQVRAWALHHDAPSWCLFREPMPEALLALAPYLRRIGRGHVETARFFEQGFGDAWGILFSTPASSKLLRIHLRKFFKVRTEEGAKLLFRWYDPRVLRVFLPSLNAAEVERFFGPITTFIAEGVDEGTFHVFRKTADGLSNTLIDAGRGKVTEIPWKAAAPNPEAPPLPGGRLLTWTLSRASYLAFGEAARDQFVVNQVESLKRTVPVQTKKLGLRVSSMVKRGMAEAEKFGLTAESEVADFLRFWFTAEFNVEKRWPGAGEVLSNEDLSGDDKISMLRELAT